MDLSHVRLHSEHCFTCSNTFTIASAAHMSLVITSLTLVLFSDNEKYPVF